LITHARATLTEKLSAISDEWLSAFGDSQLLTKEMNHMDSVKQFRAARRLLT
jgi:hypothetical protein